MIFWVYHVELYERMKTLFTALVPEIFKLENANEMTDDVIHSTKYIITCINGAILANLQRRLLKLGRLIVVEKL